MKKVVEDIWETLSKINWKVSSVTLDESEESKSGFFILRLDPCDDVEHRWIEDMIAAFVSRGDCLNNVLLLEHVMYLTQKADITSHSDITPSLFIRVDAVKDLIEKHDIHIDSFSFLPTIKKMEFSMEGLISAWHAAGIKMTQESVRAAKLANP